MATLQAGLDAFDARMNAAEKELAPVANQVDKTHIVALIDGTILANGVESVEVVQPGQTVAILVDLRRIELRVFIPEGEIGKAPLDGSAHAWVEAKTRFAVVFGDPFVIQ